LLSVFVKTFSTLVFQRKLFTSANDSLCLQFEIEIILLEVPIIQIVKRTVQGMRRNQEKKGQISYECKKRDHFLRFDHTEKKMHSHTNIRTRLEHPCHYTKKCQSQSQPGKGIIICSFFGLFLFVAPGHNLLLMPHNFLELGKRNHGQCSDSYQGDRVFEQSQK